jgi:hypothetical protein
VLSDLTCPICSADVPLAGDEKPGEQVICTYCGAPLAIVPGENDEEYELEEDY